MKKELSIIIVNYNGKRFLKNCIESIFKMCQGISYEIIIVDNASQDDSVKFLETNYSDTVKLIKSADNLGFAKGNNLGFKHSQGTYILLLNNDTVLKHNLKQALHVIKQAQVGALGIKMLGKNNEYRHSVGYFPKAIKLLKLSKLYNKSNGFKTGNFKSSKPKEVEWVEGSFLMTKAEIYNKVNGLDEDYFMYVEDIDICKKITTLNYKILYLPNLEYIHFGGYGISREKMLKNGFNKYINKHFNFPKKQLALLSVAVNFTFKDVKKAFKKNS